MVTPAETQTDSNVVLIQRARQGCAESWEALVREHHLALRQYLARRLGNAATADDIAQDAFVAAMGQLDRLHDDSAFRGWLFSIARNKAIDCLRRSSRTRLKTMSELEILIARHCVNRTEQTDSSRITDVHQTLHNCLSKLGESSRLLIREFYFDGLTAEAIASSRNQKGSSIRMALLRVRKVLAKCIRKNLDGEL